MGKALLWPPLARQGAGRVLQSLLLRSITAQGHSPNNNAPRFAQFLYRPGGVLPLLSGKGQCRAGVLCSIKGPKIPRGKCRVSD
jgi:hypothetical protein